MRSLSETLAPQLAQLTKLARMVDERGFYVVLLGPTDRHARKYSLIMDKRLFVYFSGGMTRFVEEWGRLNGHRKPVRIVVREADVDPDKFVFAFEVPNRVRFRPIIASLDLFSQERKGRYHRTPYQGAGFLKCSKLVDRYEYHGTGKAALTAVVRVLEMPHHREILMASNRKGE